MSNFLLTGDSAAMDELLRYIAVIVHDALPDALACGIIIRDIDGANADVRPAAASGPIAEQADRLQCTRGDGPSLDSLSTATVFHVDDTSIENRWTGFGPAMTSLGVGAAIFLPLGVDGRILGVLNVYRGRARRYTAADTLDAGVLADQAAVILVTADRFAALVERNRHLEKALESRATIDQAIGVIMAAQHCTAPEALEVMRRASRYRNRRVRDIAATIVASTDRPLRSSAGPATPLDV